MSFNSKKVTQISHISTTLIKDTRMIEESPGNFRSNIVKTYENGLIKTLNRYAITVEKQSKPFSTDVLFSVYNANTEYKNFYKNVLKENIVTGTNIIEKLEAIRDNLNNEYYNERQKVQEANSIVISIYNLESINNNLQYILLDELNKRVFVVNSLLNIYSLILKIFYADRVNVIPTLNENEQITFLSKFTPIKSNIVDTDYYKLYNNNETGSLSYSSSGNLKHQIYINIPDLLSKLKELSQI